MENKTVRIGKRFLALLLSFVMVFGLLPAVTLASEDAEAEPQGIVMSDADDSAVTTEADEATDVLEDSIDAVEEQPIEENGAKKFGNWADFGKKFVRTERQMFFAKAKDVKIEGALPVRGSVKAERQDFIKSWWDLAFNMILGTNAADETEAADAQPAAEGPGDVLASFDITILDADQEEWQPEEGQPVEVTLTDESFGDGRELTIYHEGEEGLEFVANVVSVNNTVTFKAEHFSVYVVVDQGQNARIKVVFHQADGSTVDIYVKKADTTDSTMYATVLYDPGAGEIENGNFRGWVTSSTYDAATTLLTIANIRTTIASLFTDDLKDADVEGGKIVDYYPAIFKYHTVTYLSDDADPLTVGTASIEYPACTNGQVSYTVSMGYTVDDTHNFEGWVPTEDTASNIISGTPVSEVIGGETISYYPNDTEITIKGDVTFIVHAPEGNWLIFNENGKGATYTAPQFVLKNAKTVTPSTIDIMARNGYTFGGWYDSAENAAAHAADPEGTTTGAYVFGQTLTQNTTIYASWIPAESANYTVLVWTQNLECNGYDFAASENLTGTVGNTVAQENKVTITENGDNPYATVNGTAYNFIGFAVKSVDLSAEIVPEGTTVVNVYYDRVEYTLRFYFARQASNGTGNFTFSNQAANDPNNMCGDWSYSRTTIPRTTFTPSSDTIGNYTYYYYSITAKYGTDITAKWPSYSLFNDDSYEMVSWILMPGAKAKKGNTGAEATVKGVISTMDEQVLGNLADKDGNYLTGRYAGSFNRWLYRIYVEALENETAPTSVSYVDADGNAQTETSAAVLSRTFTVGDTTKTYYLSEVVPVRSGSTQQSGQHAPSYIGFKYVGEDKVNTVYTMNYIYDREVYKVTFMDGVYRSGRDALLQDNSGNAPLETSSDISFGADISAFNDKKATLPAGEAGYVFEGWYMDKACTSKYTFDTMPVDGVIVYAKWRQIQYRAFLHTGITTKDDDSNLSWGSTTQALSFRVDYGGHLSAPTGTRDGYKFFGWYTEDGTPFNEMAFTFNEQTVTTAYDKTTTMTDPETTSEDGMHLYGPWDVTTTGATNSDITGWDDDGNESTPGKDRYWVTKKLDLYAKWSKVLDGAEGIGLEYYLEEGFVDSVNGETITNNNTPPKDDSLYLDNSEATASTAPTAPDGYVFDRWVVESYATGEYEPTNVEVLPGETFEVHEGDAKQVIIASHVDEKTGKTVIDEATYTIRLVAVYKVKEEATPTHIARYSNYGTENEGKGTQYRYDTKDAEGNDTLKINDAVDTYGIGEGESIPTRAGYAFIGWTKTKGGTTADFIEWDGTNYTEYGTGKDASKVAADEMKNADGGYDDLYAVWDAQQTDYTVEFYYQSESGDDYVIDDSLTATRKDKKTGETAQITDADKGQTKSGKYKLNEEKNDAWSATVEAEFNDSGETVGTTVLKVYFDLNKVEVTVEHYLLGTTTAFKTDTIADQIVGSTYNATPETTYQEKTLTVNSYDPSQAITVKTSDNLIKIYYTLSLTITAETKSQTYNGTPLNGEYTVTGALTDDEAAIKTALGTAPSITNVSESPKDYLTTDDQAKITGIPTYYVVTYTPGTLTINPAAVTITAQDKEFTYTGEAQSWPEYDVDGLIGDDKIEAVVTGSITLPSESPVTNELTSYEFTTGTAGNYTVTTANGQLTMTNASVAITIKAADDEKTYDGSALTNAEVTVTSGELLEGDKLVATAEGSATNVADTKTGNNPIKAGYKVMHGAEDVTANYKITTEAGTLTINPKAVTVTAEDKTFAYSGTAKTWPEYDVDGLIGDDKIEAVVTGSITFPSESPVTNKLESYKFTTGDSKNYKVTTKDGQLKMTNASAEITITAADDEKTYDGSALTNTKVTVTSGKLLEGDELVAEASGSATNVADTKTGNNPIKAGYKVVHGEEDVTANYAITTEAGTLKINPKPVTVTTGSANKAYDGKPLTKDDAKIEGIVEGETVKVTATGSQTEVGKSENTYKIEWVTAKEANYTISDTLGELEVKDWEAEKTTPDVTSNYKLGEKIPFTIKVTNTSDIEMKGVIVEDTNAVLVAGTGYTVTDNKATVDIPANGTVEIKAEHVVTSEDILAGTVGTKATVTYGDSEKEVETKTDKLGEVDTTLTVVKKITNKPADGEAFKLGETIEYTITAKNDGNVPYENVVIKDDLTGASKTVAKLGVGESAELKTSYVVTSDDILAGSVKNKATADADPVDPEDPDSPKPHGEDEVETGDKEDPDNPPPIEEPNPSLDVVKRVTSKAANGDAYVLDEEVTYTITVKNDGNLPITNVKVKDDLTGLDETIDKLEPGDTKTFNTTYTVTKDDVEAGSVKNVATADGENKSDKPTDPGEDEVEVKTGENEEELPPYVPSHVNIHVYKVWKNDGDVAAETRPASVTVVLLKNGKPVAKKQLNEENHWHCEWHRENDGFYEDYSVEELPVEGYVTTIKWKIDGNNPNGGRIYTVTNTITNLIDDHVAYSVGYPDGTVGPNRNITRAEVATIFFRLLTDEARDRYWSQTNPYTDVMPEAWYNNAISTLSNMGILNGYADGTFRPNNPITRAELTKIASSFFGTADLSDKVSSFTDVSSDAWYSSFIKAAEDLGLVNGYGDGTFLPDNYITRAETFAIVNRTLKRAPHKDHLLPGYMMNVFPDNMDTSAWYFADVQEATNSHDYKWVTEGTKTVEEWTAKLPERDWTALEHSWSDSHIN